MMPDLKAWAIRQKAAMIEAGVHPLDAEAAVQWTLDHIPAGEDPDAWLPAQQLIIDTVRRAEADAITDARATWYADEDVPQRYKYILDATPVEDEEDGREAEVATALLLYLFLRDKGRYYTAKPFRPVAERNVRGLLDGHIMAQEAATFELATAYAEHRVAPAPWLEHMRTTLRRLHLDYRSLGAGGYANLNADDLLLIDAELMADGVRIHNFAAEIFVGLLSLAQIQNRLQMYIGNGRAQFWEARRGHGPRIRQGQTLIERRILGVARHCRSCVEYYHRGWQPAGALPPPGRDSECMSNCRCSLVSRIVDDGELSAWIGTMR